MSEKQPLIFLIFQKLCQNINKKPYISGIIWAFKSKLQIIHATAYIALFLLDSNNCVFWYVQWHTSISISISPIFSFFFYFHLLFYTLLATRHILQFTMFHSISLQLPVILLRQKILHSALRKKDCRVNYNQPNAVIFSCSL